MCIVRDMWMAQLMLQAILSIALENIKVRLLFVYQILYSEEGSCELRYSVKKMEERILAFRDAQEDGGYHLGGVGRGLNVINMWWKWHSLGSMSSFSRHDMLRFVNNS